MVRDLADKRSLVDPDAFLISIWNGTQTDLVLDLKQTDG